MRLYDWQVLLNRLYGRAEQAEGGCLIWQGAVNSKGYGTISVHGETQYVHRLMYAIHHGEAPAGEFVCHTCDTRRCIAPEHLFLGTPKDNHKDMETKGRAWYFGKPPKQLEVVKDAVLCSLQAGEEQQGRHVAV